MSKINIGRSDRGAFDKQDNLYVKKNHLKNGLSAKEASDFAKGRPGAEAIIKHKDGSYSVHDMTTSEAGKSITNEDFTDEDIVLSNGHLEDNFDALKAYVATSDNYIRTLEFPDIKLDYLGQDYATADFDLVLEDKDGLESLSKKDLIGTISGKLTLTEELMKNQVEVFNQKNSTLGLSLNKNIKKQKYVIDISVKGLPAATLTLKMNNGYIEGEIDASLLTTATVGLAGSAIGEKYVKDKAVEFLSTIGLKAKGTGHNDLKLTPDFKNNGLISNVKVGDINLKLEDVKTTTGNTNFRIDQYGDLNVSIKNARAIASTNSNSKKLASLDSEGPDRLEAKIKASHGTDNTIKIATEVDLDIHINDSEKSALSDRVEKLTGKEIEASGDISISDVKVETEINLKDGTKSVSQKGKGTIDIKNLNIDLGSTNLIIDSTKGDLSLSEKSGKKELTANNVTLNGKVITPEAEIMIKELAVDGKVIHDQEKPNILTIESNPKKDIKLSMSIKDNSGEVSTKLDKLRIKGAKAEVDTSTGNVSFKQSNSSRLVEIKELKLGDLNFRNLKYSGELSANMKTGKIVLNSENIQFNGKIGDLELSNLKGTGKITFDPKTGTKIENSNIQASGKIGGFDISKLKGNVDLQFDPNGQLVLSDVSNFTLGSSSGLKVSGDLKASYKNGFYKLKTNPSKPLNINFKQSNSDLPSVSNLFVDGDISFNEKNKTLSLNNNGKVFNIKKGNISGIDFDNVKIKGSLQYKNGLIKLNNRNSSSQLTGKINDLNIGELKAKGEVNIDPKTKSISWNDEVSIDLPEKGLKLSANGDTKLNVTADGKYILEAKGSKVNATFGENEIKNLTINGKVIFDPKTNQVSFSGNNQSEELKVFGEVNGSKVDFVAKGEVEINKVNNQLELIGKDINLAGKLDDLEIKTLKGTNGKLVLDSEGKIDVVNLDYEIDIDGIIIGNKLDFSESESGYQIKLSGDYDVNHESLGKVLNKLKNSNITDEKIDQILTKVNTYLEDFQPNSDSKFEEIAISLNKDFSFESIKFNTEDFNLSLPKYNIDFNSTGKFSIAVDESGKIIGESSDGKINTNIDGIKLENVNLKGSFSLDPKTQELNFAGLGEEKLHITGSFNKMNVDLKSSGDIKLKESKGDLEFQADSVYLDGKIEDFELKTVSPVSGKFVVKENGGLDFSDFKYELQVDDIVVSNKSGSLKGNNKDGYEIKLSGDIVANEQSLIKFMTKMSDFKHLPKFTRDKLRDVVNNVNGFLSYGDMKNGKYDDLTIVLDKDFKFKEFSVDTSAKLVDSKFKLAWLDKDKPVTVGDMDISTRFHGDSENFGIEDSKVKFNITKDFRSDLESLMTNKLNEMGMKNIDLELGQDGKLKVKNATYEIFSSPVDKLGKAIEDSGVPFGKLFRLTDISADVSLNTEIKDNKLIISFDETSVNQFLANIAVKATDALGITDMNSFAAKKVTQKLTDLKINFFDKESKLSVDLNEIMKKQVSEDLTLKSSNITDKGEVDLHFSYLATENNNYSKSKVSQNVSKINNIFVQKKSDKNAAELKKLLLSSNPEELSKTLDKVTIYNVINKLKDEDNIESVLVYLSKNSNVGNNNQHLKEFMNHVDDDITYNVLNKVSNPELRNVESGAKIEMVDNLSDGNTNNKEEKQLSRIVIQSKFKDMNQTIEGSTIKRLRSELDDSDFANIMKKMVQAESYIDRKESMKHFSAFAKVSDDDTTMKFLNSINNNDLKKVNSSGKVYMLRALIKGNTNNKEENAVKRILLSSTKSQIDNILKYVKLETIKDELDSKDYNQVLAYIK